MADSDSTSQDASAFLNALGERIRTIRARRGISRKMLADSARVSLRYLSDLENGTGNASILLLRQVAHALDVPIAEVVTDAPERSVEYLLLVEALSALPDERLSGARAALAEFVNPEPGTPKQASRIALIGLRGAGKSSIGRRLAEALGRPFRELNQEIVARAGVSVGEIHSLYGQAVYRRHERQCLDQVIADETEIVLATPGSIVSEPTTFNQLLTHFYTIWLRAEPEEHMARVLAQGDTRPMAGNAEAMADLNKILAGRTPFYAKADLTVSTSKISEEAVVAQIIAQLPGAGTHVTGAVA